MAHQTLSRAATANLVNAFKQQLLSACYAPGINTGEGKINKVKIPIFEDFLFYSGRLTREIIIAINDSRAVGTSRLSKAGEKQEGFKEEVTVHGD